MIAHICMYMYANDDILMGIVSFLSNGKEGSIKGDFKR